MDDRHEDHAQNHAEKQRVEVTDKTTHVSSLRALMPAALNGSAETQKLADRGIAKNSSLTRRLALAISILRPLPEIEGELQDGDRANHGYAQVDAVVDLIEGVPVAQLVGARILEKDKHAVARGQQNDHWDNTEKLEYDLSNSARELPCPTGEVDALPDNLKDGEGDSAPEECPPYRRKHEWTVLKENGARSEDQKWVLGDQQEPGKEQGAKEDLCDCLGERARAA